MRELTAEEIEENLQMDLRAYGACFWKLADDGRKVRISPRNIRVTDDGRIYSGERGTIHGLLEEKRHAHP